MLGKLLFVFIRQQVKLFLLYMRSREKSFGIEPLHALAFRLDPFTPPLKADPLISVVDIANDLHPVRVQRYLNCPTANRPTVPLWIGTNNLPDFLVGTKFVDIKRAKNGGESVRAAG